MYRELCEGGYCKLDEFIWKLIKFEFIFFQLLGRFSFRKMILSKRMFIYIFKWYVNLEGASNRDVSFLTANVFRSADNPKKLLVSSSANSSFVPVDEARK